MRVVIKERLPEVKAVIGKDEKKIRR